MGDQRQSNAGALEKLKDAGLTLEDASQDIRERKVLDRHGAEIGHVSGLFIDPEERKVRMLEVRGGGFLGIGDRHFLLPVDAITSVAKDVVYVSETLERIVHSPVYDPALVLIPADRSWEPIYGYYGLSPYWTAGYTYPGFPTLLKEAEREPTHPAEVQQPK